MTTGGTDTPPASSAAEAAKKKNVLERIAGVLFAPADAFQEIARRPDVLAPLIFLVLVGYISTIFIVPRLDMSAIASAQEDAMRKKNPNLSEADLERMGRIGAAGTKVLLWSLPVLLIAVYVIVAAVLLLAFRLMGGEGTFKQSLSATLYAWVPLAILGIITAIVVFAHGTYDPTTAPTIVKSNPSFLVEMKEQPLVFSLLSSLDVFTIWMIVLLIFGFAAVSRMSRASAAAIILSLWVAAILMKLGIAALTMPGA
jgi:hypothetical protein